MGKKYKRLIEQITSPENMRNAYRLTAKGRRYTPGYLQFKEYAEVNLAVLADELLNGTYVSGPVHQFHVYEPKPRLISALPFRDRVAQHAVYGILNPIFDSTLLPRTFACRKGKGTHEGVKALQSDLRRLGQPMYFLKTDYSKFFPSIRRDVLHRMIRKKITCHGTMRVLEAMIEPKGVGLPIGSLTSQLFANVYGGVVDRFIHFDLGMRYWYRYMDDIVILHEDVALLHDVRERVQDFSERELGLRFSKWSIAPVSRGINFLGYRIWASHKLLRKQSIVRAKRAVQAMRRQNRLDDLRKFAASWGGHAMWADAHRLLLTLGLEDWQMKVINTLSDLEAIRGTPDFTEAVQRLAGSLTRTTDVAEYPPEYNTPEYDGPTIAPDWQEVEDLATVERFGVTKQWVLDELSDLQEA